MGQSRGMRGFPGMGQFSPRAADPQTARFQPKPGMGQPLQGQKPPMGGFKPPPNGGGLQAGYENWQRQIQQNPGLMNQPDSGYQGIGRDPNRPSSGGSLPSWMTGNMGSFSPQQGGGQGGGGFGGGWDPNGFTNGGLAQIGRAAGGMQQNPWDGTMFGMPMQGGGGGGVQGGMDSLYSDRISAMQNPANQQLPPNWRGYGQGQQGGGGSFGDLMGGFGGFGAPAGGGMQGGPVPGQSVAPPEQFGPGDQGPGNYAGMSGSDIFARLFGQRP